MLNKVVFITVLVASGVIGPKVAAEAMTATTDALNEIAQEEIKYTISDNLDSKDFDAKPETVDPATVSAFELRRQAAQRAPIPDFVINDTVRNY